MFDQIFERSDALRRQLAAPLREERMAYLRYWADGGATRGSLRYLARFLLTPMVETVLPNFYLPGYGLRGVPLYLIAHPADYLRDVYSEPELGLTSTFGKVVEGTKEGGVAFSPRVQDFWQIPTGKPTILGRDDQQRTVNVPMSGVLAFLPGMPPQAVTDRQG
jgi:hypothetical protein